MLIVSDGAELTGYVDVDGYLYLGMGDGGGRNDPEKPALHFVRINSGDGNEVHGVEGEQVVHAQDPAAETDRHEQSAPLPQRRGK